MDNDREIDVPFGSKDKVVKPFGITIAITGTADYGQTGVGKLETCCYRYCPAVEGVERVDIEVIGDLCMAADTGDQHDIVKGLPFPFHVGKYVLQRVLDGEIPAARAPGVLGIL
jgi:hypothetical protein